jgi:hypothetical protein
MARLLMESNMLEVRVCSCEARASGSWLRLVGNTWQGGTGGADTAGMGGKGGPYRLDLNQGHDVHQISEQAKADISKEVQEAAREMGQKELEKRLEQIRMDPGESKLYDQ